MEKIQWKEICGVYLLYFTTGTRVFPAEAADTQLSKLSVETYPWPVVCCKVHLTRAPDWCSQHTHQASTRRLCDHTEVSTRDNNVHGVS